MAGTLGHRSTYNTKKGAESKNITSAEYQAVLSEVLVPQGQTSTEAMASLLGPCSRIMTQHARWLVMW